MIDVDSGSRHEALVTEDGDVYTWGNGNHGNLGHDDYEDRYDYSILADLFNRDTPTRVEWVRNHGYKAVAVGAGGYIAWDGGFTVPNSTNSLLIPEAYPHG